MHATSFDYSTIGSKCDRNSQPGTISVALVATSVKMYNARTFCNSNRNIHSLHTYIAFSVIV